jgi:hypothetical protein
VKIIELIENGYQTVGEVIKKVRLQRTQAAKILDHRFHVDVVMYKKLNHVSYVTIQEVRI